MFRHLNPIRICLPSLRLPRRPKAPSLNHPWPPLTRREMVELFAEDLRDTQPEARLAA